MATSTRATGEGNVLRADQATNFANLFFGKQDKEKDTLCELYHDQSTLIWNGEIFKTKTSIAKFYQKQQPVETTLECLDVQILPQMGDVIDMITILAGGKVKQNDKTSNFSRTFLLGPSIQGKDDYLIVTDTMRTAQ